MDEQQKPKWTPPDPTIVMLKIQQALIDAPDAKYIEVSGYRKYASSNQIDFERGLPSLALASAGKERIFDKWITTKWYIPADANMTVIDPAAEYKSQYGQNPVNLVAYGLTTETPNFAVISIPKESYLNIIVRDADTPEIEITIKNHILSHLGSLYKMNGNPRKDLQIGLTMKNWKILSKEPSTNFSSMIQMKHGIPQTTYVLGTKWKKKNNAA